MAILRRVILNGFKSIKMMDIELHNLNVLIGANGAGKSNLVSFFKMLNEMMAGRLQRYIADSGRSQSLLHFGPKVTPQITAKLEFEAENGLDIYEMRLFHAPGDTLYFAEETLSFLQKSWKSPKFDVLIESRFARGINRPGQKSWKSPKTVSLGTGHPETRIGEKADDGEKTAQVFKNLLNRCRVYHFHDTSPMARVRQFCYIGDNRWLMPDAGNLAALLYRLRNENNGSAYQPIVATIRSIAPFFDDFELEPSGPGKKDIILNWRGKKSDQVFGPHQLSDGTLRAISLITLLLQPEDELPGLVIVDEPELGLHPYALNVIASLFSKASHHT